MAARSLATLKDPVPDEVQVPEEAGRPTAPFMVAVLPAQMVRSTPALTVGVGNRLMVTASFREGQGPPGVPEVSVRVTAPEAISAAVGVYVVFRTFGLAKLPVPLLVHVPVVLPPVMLPASVMAEEVLAHTF